MIDRLVTFVHWQILINLLMLLCFVWDYRCWIALYRRVQKLEQRLRADPATPKESLK